MPGLRGFRSSLADRCKRWAASNDSGVDAKRLGWKPGEEIVRWGVAVDGLIPKSGLDFWCVKPGMFDRRLVGGFALLFRRRTAR